MLPLLLLHNTCSVKNFWQATAALYPSIVTFHFSVYRNKTATQHCDLPTDLERFEQDRETFCTGSAKKKNVLHMFTYFKNKNSCLTQTD